VKTPLRADTADLDVARLRASAHRLAFRFLRPGSVPTPGVHRSIFRGHGLSFAGYREYQHGDDIRLVDWNVTARQNRPMVKLFEQEHASALMIALDASPSMTGPHPEKWRAARELAVLFAFVAARDGERVGLLLTGEAVETALPPRRGFAHANRLAHWLQSRPLPPHAAGLEAAVGRASRSLRGPGAIVIASDFLDPRWDMAVREAVRRHTVIGVVISAPQEHTLEDVGLVRVRDVETGAMRWIDTASARVRAAFAARSLAIRRQIRTRLVDAGAIAVSVRTDRPMLAELASICRMRGAA
jgi:uncharacterized protein (DUF58 family)